MKNTVYKLIILVSVFCFDFLNVFGQGQQKNYTLTWPSDSIGYRFWQPTNAPIFFPRYQTPDFGELPSVYLKLEVSNPNNQLRININSQTSAIINKANPDYALIQNHIQLKYHTVKQEGKYYLLISFLPILKSPDGNIFKINEFSLDIQATREAALVVKNKSYQSSSVLASGNWFKIGVKEEGVYKLSYDFLKKLGLDVNNLNPKNIRLYGNGGYPLAQKNSDFRYDDLQENTIEVVGEADEKLNESDYVLFYAPGNIRWSLVNNQYFQHQQNAYTDSSYYFITVDKSLGKRITKQNPSDQANYQSNSYHDYQLYEKDLYSLITATVKSGRNWYGEDFEFNSTRNFEFTGSSIVPNSDVFVITEMAIRSNNVSNALVRFNNQTLYNLTASSVPLSFDTEFAKQVNAVSSVKYVPSTNNTINITYNKPNSLSNAWLDYIELNTERSYQFTSGYLRFRDLRSVSAGAITKFNLPSLSSDSKIWDITDFLNPIAQTVNFSTNSSNFVRHTSDLKEFVLFNNNGLKEPYAIGKVPNQNLHGLQQADFLIITHPTFYNEAKRLADFRKAQQGISYHLVTTEQVFNEFSSGGREASAIRDFVKMFYDRAQNNSSLAPKYLLLVGKGSFDNKMLKFKENNFVVTYQSENSLSPTQSYTSDDYFGLLDDNEGEFSEDYSLSAGLLDIAIGRLPVKTVEEAKNVVDKLINYQSSASFGDWRNQIAVIADDEDNNLHLNQAEANGALITQLSKNPNIDKLYFDAFQQESAASGSTYPKVTEAINQKVNSGTFLINYTGHGGENGWAQERVLTINDINNWQNTNKLAIIFTATCSFSRWDDPEVVSAGEHALLNRNSGVPSLFSTTRIVYASYNFDLNQSFLRALFNTNNAQKKVTFGEVFKNAKNNNVGGLNINSRNFTLLGDPTALFPIPTQQIITTQLPDTLKAGQKVLIKGYVASETGSLLNQFNGFIYPTIYDKPAVLKTLGQDAFVNGSYVQSFQKQKNIVYKGKATVSNGQFSYEFIVPRDINLQMGKGKISYYADNQSSDAAGFVNTLNIGGISNSSENDKEGPTIQLFLNDESFVSGGITNKNPILLINLFDESGVNTTGIGIGHDIVATLSSANEAETNIILNDYYQANLDSYQKGAVKYQLSTLSPGFYTLKVKVWDVFNNSSEQIITFEVKETEALVLNRVLNYPNPFTTRTSFQFEHNYPNEDLEVQINIKTITGRLIKTINQLVNSSGNRVNNIFWDAKDDFGEKIARGVYVYELKVRSTSSGFSAKKTEKLLIL